MFRFEFEFRSTSRSTILAGAAALENNQHARRFYAALGGELSGRVQSTVRGYPVIEVSYVYRL